MAVWGEMPSTAFDNPGAVSRVNGVHGILHRAAQSLTTGGVTPSELCRLEAYQIISRARLPADAQIAAQPTARGLDGDSQQERRTQCEGEGPRSRDLPRVGTIGSDGLVPSARRITGRSSRERRTHLNLARCGDGVRPAVAGRSTISDNWGLNIGRSARF